MIIAGDQIKIWTSRQIFGREDGFDEKCTALGVSIRNQIVCGVVYSDYKPGISIELSIASVDRRWCTRHNLRILLSYPFIQLGLKRVQCFCSVHNEEAISMLTRLGFAREGVHRMAYHNGDDAYSYALFDDNKWIGK